jgi:hypothetical protein
MTAAPPQARRPALAGVSQPDSRVAARVRAVLSSTWTLGALVFVATWGGGAVPEMPGLDNTAHAGYHMAATLGLDHGHDLVFPYGPLGFLKSYLVLYPGLARLAAAYGIALHLAVSLSLVWAARRSFGLLLGVAFALVAAALLRGELPATAVREDGAVVALAFLWCVVALSDNSPSWTRRLVVIAAGPFAALELIAKPNAGLVAFGLLAVAIVAMDGNRRRNVATFASLFALCAAGLWAASGQGLGNVGGYVSGSFELVAGYSSGARLEYGTREYDYLLAPIVIGVATAIAWISTRDTAPRRRAVILALFAAFAFVAFKAGLVSHEAFHMATFYSMMLAACLAFRLPRTRAIRLGSAIAVAGVAAAGFTASFSGYPMTDPLENARNGVSTLATLADTDRLEAKIADGRATLIDAYDIDPRTLALVDRRPVHIDPSEAGAAWAYGLKWHPLPVFQTYAAWTEDLDRRNASALASPDGPSRILREDGSPVGRYPGWESPAAMIEMLCNFRAIRSTERWQVLSRTGDRCGEPRSLGAVEARYGEPIGVPEVRGDHALIARVDLPIPALERVRTLLHRPHSRQVLFDGGEPDTVIPATVGDGVLLTVPRRLDFAEPFALAPNPRTVTFLRDFEGATDPLTIEFLEMPISDA